MNPYSQPYTPTAAERAFLGLDEPKPLPAVDSLLSIKYRNNRREPGSSGRGRPARTHDNTRARDFVRRFADVREMQARYPRTEDVLTGVLALRTAGDNSRGLSRKHLFRILRWLDHVTTREVQALLGSRYAERTCQQYAVAATIASRALENFINALPEAQAEREMAEAYVFPDPATFEHMQQEWDADDGLSHWH